VNVPAVVNVCDALWPFCSTPVLKLPLFAVAVCALGPWFVQVTGSPTWIVIVAGVNWKSAIATVVAFAAWGSGAGQWGRGRRARCPLG